MVERIYGDILVVSPPKYPHIFPSLRQFPESHFFSRSLELFIVLILTPLRYERYEFPLITTNFQKPLTVSVSSLTMRAMKDWNLKTDDPGAYILAADSRCGPIDYVNDQIWNLHLERSEPPSLTLRTTFGLRAPSLRLFPRFIEGDTAITDPNSFSSQPVVKRFYPNYLRVAFSPFMAIDVEVEYWVPNSHAIAGRVQITNSR